MAGSVFMGYGGKAKPDPEYNVAADIEAARAVLAAPWDITWAPLDSCGTLHIVGERYRRLANSKAPRAAAVIESFDHWANRKCYQANESSVLFDTEAAYLCVGQDDCKMKTIKLRIDDKGLSVPDDKHGRPVHCALAIKNRAALEEFIEQALTQPE
jgi:inosine-uridine nucleoside N-ribohydrolase